MGFKLLKKRGEALYIPAGPAFEYSNVAVNLYEGCNYGCVYCYAPRVLKRDRKDFHEHCKERENILDRLKRDLERYLLEGERVLMCFTCDPYQEVAVQTGLTRKVLELFKEYNVNFSILTKAGTVACDDFDLYKQGDQFGSTLTFTNCDFWRDISAQFEPFAATPQSRYDAIKKAHEMGITTFVSEEPVLNSDESLQIIRDIHLYVDMFKVGTLNVSNCTSSPLYSELKKIKDTTDWGKFGTDAEDLLISLKKDYYIKDDLRKYMNGGVK